MGGVGAKFDRFIENIQLTPAQRQDAMTKHNNVRSSLHATYYGTYYDGSTSLLVGSYGKGTAVRPPSDIDILCIMPDSEWHRFNMYSGNKQSALLQSVKTVLQRTFPNTAMRADGQVIMVPFVSFNVEVVPAFRLQSGDYYICDTNDGGSWKITSPRTEMDRISTSNARSGGKAIHLIKMMKVWKREYSVPIKSLAIEMLAADFLSSWPYYAMSTVYYDWMVRDFLAYLTQQAGSFGFVPGTTELLFYGTDWKTKAETAYRWASSACEFEASTSLFANEYANMEWQKVFGKMFVG